MLRLGFHEHAQPNITELLYTSPLIVNGSVTRNIMSRQDAVLYLYHGESKFRQMVKILFCTC